MIRNRMKLIISCCSICFSYSESFRLWISSVMSRKDAPTASSSANCALGMLPAWRPAPGKTAAGHALCLCVDTLYGKADSFAIGKCPEADKTEPLFPICRARLWPQTEFSAVAPGGGGIDIPAPMGTAPIAVIPVCSLSAALAAYPLFPVNQAFTLRNAPIMSWASCCV